MEEISEPEAYLRTKYLNDLDKRLKENIKRNQKDRSKSDMLVKESWRVLVYLAIAVILLVSGFQIAGKFFELISVQ